MHVLVLSSPCVVLDDSYVLNTQRCLSEARLVDSRLGDSSSATVLVVSHSLFSKTGQSTCSASINGQRVFSNLNPSRATHSEIQNRPPGEAYVSSSPALSPCVHSQTPNKRTELYLTHLNIVEIERTSRLATIGRQAGTSYRRLVR